MEKQENVFKVNVVDSDNLMTALGVPEEKAHELGKETIRLMLLDDDCNNTSTLISKMSEKCTSAAELAALVVIVIKTQKAISDLKA